MTFLPGGNILVSERSGKLRIVRDGVLDPQPIAGVPKVNTRANAGLYDFVLHPKYAQNQWIYFAFSKPGEGSLSSTVLARAKLDGRSLTQVQELYSTHPGTNVGGSRLAFALDGTILMTTPAAGVTEKAQDPASAYGKILRLNDDGSIPRDNPFVGKAGYRPEIYTLGHRDHLGLVVHPSGTIFNAEHGPNGGDEVNLIKPGANYGCRSSASAADTTALASRRTRRAWKSRRSCGCLPSVLRESCSIPAISFRPGRTTSS